MWLKFSFWGQSLFKESNLKLHADLETQKTTTNELEQKLGNYETLSAKYEDLSLKYEALHKAQKNAADPTPLIQERLDEFRLETLETQKRQEEKIDTGQMSLTCQRDQ